jgi:hypothetical protein
MLLWDAWGLADERSSTQNDLDLLDRIADITATPDPALAKLHELYHADPRIPVPGTITSYDPLGGLPREIALERLVPGAV